LEGDATDPVRGNEFGQFDELVAAIDRWSRGLADWPVARMLGQEWEEVAGRIRRMREELTRVLVVGVVGGTGTGKSTLVNALAGREVTEAGDIARPTTVQPVVVAAADTDTSWLPLASWQARLVRSDSPAITNIVLIDCPDPDTQATHTEHPGQAGAADHNRDRLEAVLPLCDVLLLVSTAQKYRSWIVVREVAAFAPGRPLLFVQTHASRDPDIRADWRRELESQGFEVPRIFRLDAVNALRRRVDGLAAEDGFHDLLATIDTELVGRAARRVRRTGGFDLVNWFMQRAMQSLASARRPVADLVVGVETQTRRLEAILARGLEQELRAGRGVWQRVLGDEMIDRWHAGPFGMFLQGAAAIASFWTRMRPRQGVVGRLLLGPTDPGGQLPATVWQSVEQLGLPEAEVEQSRSILVGLASRAGLGPPLVGRARLDDESIESRVVPLLGRAGNWLTDGLRGLVAERQRKVAGPLVRGLFELLFSSVILAVLARAGVFFFYGRLWQGRPADGAGFLQEAVVWVLLWGLLLRWLLLRIVRAGFDRDIAGLTAQLPQARLIAPLLEDYAVAARESTTYLEESVRLAERSATLASQGDADASDLGRLRTLSRS
jgi:hypothetical protein